MSYYNDSKSTSAEAVVTALEALERPTILLCGGKDIGEELNRITEAPWDNVKVVICFGEAGDRLCRADLSQRPEGLAELWRCPA